MRGIFISYRRDDAAGHAGRLFDALKERFGGERVFMDVSDLRPGEDFVAVLDRALAAADVVLAVIGPRWLDAVDASGRRRLDDPGDFVRRELAAALASDATVIPVLVHGARMPAAGSLPAPLQALARRQALALTDTRWESDLRDLVACLEPGDPRDPQGRDRQVDPRPRPVPDDGGGGRTGRGTLALFGLGVLAAIVGAVMLLRPHPDAGGSRAALPDRSAEATASRSADAPRAQPEAQATARDDVKRAAVTQAKAEPAFALAVPRGSSAKFHTSRAALVYELLALRLEPRDADTRTLVALVRVLNDGPLDEYFGSEQFRLVVGDVTLEPESSVIVAVDGVAAKEAAFRFVVPASARSATLLVRVGGDESRIPLALDAGQPLAAGSGTDMFGRPLAPRLVETVRPLPATLPAGQRVRMGKANVAPVEYTLVDATLERETSERASLTLTVRCAVPKDGMGINFWSSSVRLWVDGVTLAPRDLVNETVYPGESKEAKFVFDLVAMPAALEVGFVKAGERTRVPLDLSALPRTATAAQAK